MGMGIESVGARTVVAPQPRRGDVVALGIEDLNGAFLADAVAHLSGVDPNCQVRGQVLDEVRDGIAGLSGGPLHDRIVGIGHS